MKVTRRIIEIDEELWDGCGQCVPSCAEGAIQVVEGKARLVEEKYCDRDIEVSRYQEHHRAHHGGAMLFTASHNSQEGHGRGEKGDLNS